MIGELSERVAANLKARKFPHRVTYGPEDVMRDTPAHAASIVFYTDREQAAGVGAPTGWRGTPDPKAPLQRRIHGVARVFSKSSRVGATVRDHEEECYRVCDGVWIAVYSVTHGFLLETTAERLLGPAEFNNPQAWSGCVAELRFSLACRIRAVDYTGAGPATAELGAVHAPTVESTGYPDYEPDPE